jgi:uncharacterized protein YggE
MQRRLIATTILASVSLISTFAYSQTPRLITVNGEGRVNIKPDEVFINLQIRTFDKDLENARIKNDQDLDAITKIIYEFDVDRTDIEIYFSRFDPDFKDWEKEKIRGYSIIKGVSFSLTDVSALENLLCRLIEAGANQFYKIELRCSEKNNYDIQARNMALENALTKATSMADRMGMKLGKVFSISDNIPEAQPEKTTIGSWIFHARGGRSYPTSYDSEYGGSFLGKVSITAKVTVSFELE